MKKKFESDQHWMALALAQAKQGLFTAHPNPRVGCVFVRDGQLLAQGFHQVTGGPHAEVQAIQSSQHSLEGSTCYVTLEPCCHHGRTPPCVNKLIELNLKRCVIACLDPNPLVQGKGAEKLKNSGVDVEVGILEAQAKALNAGFFKRMTTGMPRVIAKIATSLDGKTAMSSGESQWITSTLARLDGHRLRAESGAVLTSWKSITEDQAKMTVRVPELIESTPHFKQPLRVVLDRTLQIHPQLSFFDEMGDVLVMISETVSQSSEQNFIAQLSKREQVQLIRLPENQDQLDLQAILLHLGQLGINDVLVESGSKLLGAFWQNDLVDTVVHYIAPKLLGTQTQGMFDFNILNLNDHKKLVFEEVIKLGPDLKVIAQVKR